jgi:hypothetical protein
LHCYKQQWLHYENFKRTSGSEIARAGAFTTLWQVCRIITGIPTPRKKERKGDGIQKCISMVPKCVIEQVGWMQQRCVYCFDRSQIDNRLCDQAGWLRNTKKQTTVSLCSAEAEYIALTDTAKEVLWMKSFLAELFPSTRINCTIFGDNQASQFLLEEHCQSLKRRSRIHCADRHCQNFLAELQPGVPFHCTIFGDNQASQAIAANPTSNDRSKHIDTRYHFIRDRVKRKEISLQWIPSEDQLADMFTKSLQKNRFNKLRWSVMLHASSWMNFSMCWNCLAIGLSMQATSVAAISADM